MLVRVLLLPAGMSRLFLLAVLVTGCGPNVSGTVQVINGKGPCETASGIHISMIELVIESPADEPGRFVEESHEISCRETEYGLYLEYPSGVHTIYAHGRNLESSDSFFGDFYKSFGTSERIEFECELGGSELPTLHIDVAAE